MKTFNLAHCSPTIGEVKEALKIEEVSITLNTYLLGEFIITSYDFNKFVFAKIIKGYEYENGFGLSDNDLVEELF